MHQVSMVCSSLDEKGHLACGKAAQQDTTTGILLLFIPILSRLEIASGSV